MRQFKPLYLMLTVCLSFGLAAGCKKKNTETVDNEATSGAEDANAADRDLDLTPDNADASADPCALRTVLFQYDSAELDAAARTEIQRAVECYKSNGSAVRLHLTGATDPRGTEEYNIALGERRAQAVRAYVVSLGVDGSRVSTSSVGEELAKGTDEKGWTEDRNVSSGGAK